MYVKTCERGHVKDFEQRSRVYNAVLFDAVFPVDPDDRVIMELQCTLTNVPYQMTVGGAFVYICENLVEVSLTILFNLNNGRVCTTWSVILQIFPCGPLRLHYNGVAVY